VTTADVNGDGHPDLIVVNQGNAAAHASGTVSVLLGTGTGTFGAQTTYAAGFRPDTVTTADVNGDGHLDLVVANAGSNTVSVLLGTPTVAVTSVAVTSPEPAGVALHIGDTLLLTLATDVAVSSMTPGSGGATPTLSLNNGGTATYTGFDSAGLHFRYIAQSAAESTADLVVTDLSLNGATVNHDASFGFAAQATFATGSLPTSVTTADVNRDGHADLIVANQDSNTVSVLLGTGTGTFGAQTTYATGSSPESVTTADVNGDGHADLIVVNQNDDTLSVLLGTGMGTFGGQTTYATGALPSSVTTADVNDDGHLDLIVTNEVDDTVSVLLGTGTGTFGGQTTYQTGSLPGAVTAADVNGDGRVDLVVANGQGTASVLLGTGTGTFVGPTDYATDGASSSIIVADLNGDGHADLIAPNGNTVSVLLGTSTGTFGTRITYATGNGASSVTVADVNGDGRPDLVVANASDNTVSVLLNNSTPGASLDAASFVRATGSDTGLLVDDPPTITGAVTGQTITDQQTDHPFSAVTIGDPVEQTETLTVTLDDATKGTLSNLGGGSYDGATGIYSISGNSAAIVTAALDGLVFTPTANHVAPGLTETTTFTIAVSDGIAPTVTDASTTVITTSANDAPVIAGTVAGQTITDQQTGSPFSGVAIGETDVGQTETLMVTLDDATRGSLSNLGGGSYDAATGIYVVSGTAADVTTALDGLVFTPTANHVAPGTTETTTFTIAVNDGVATTTDASTTVVTTSVNDTPVITGAVAGQTITDQQTDNPFTGVTIGDPDVGQTETLTVTLDDATRGALSNLGGGSYDGATGVYSVSGTAADVTAALDGLVFTPTANHVAPGATETTTFTIAVDDGIASTVDASTTVSTTSVNDPPVITGAVAGQTITDKQTDSPFSAVTIGEPDVGQTETLTVTLDDATRGSLSNLGGGSYDGVTGIYSVSGTAADVTTALDGLVFTPTANHVAPGLTETTTFAIAVNDGIASTVTDASTTVIATSVNDPPTITGAVAGQAITDEQTDRPFSGVAIGDPDVGQTETLTVTLDSATKGALSNLGGGSYNGATGVYSISGTRAAIKTAVDGLVFTPNQLAPGATETTTFTIAVADSDGATVTDASTTVVTTSARIVVTSVSATSPEPAGAALHSGDTLLFTLGTNAAVTSMTPGSGGATPTLSLNNGATATYTGFDSAGLHFSYTVHSAAENTADLKVSGLSLNGATVNHDASFGFAAQATYATDGFSDAVTTADLNGDGHADLVAVNLSHVSVLLGTGTGTFGAPTTYATDGSGFSDSVSAADVNGDGHVDLIVSNYFDNTVSVLLGTGTGTFGAEAIYAAGTTPISVATADVNGDGHADLIVLNNDDTVSVLLGSGTGTFGAPTAYAFVDQARSMTTADVNGDGVVDLVVAGGTVEVLLGTGTGTFGAPTEYVVRDFAYSVTTADVNGDGHVDLVVTSLNNTVSVLLGTGSGTFGAPTAYATGIQPTSVTVADVNGDGHADLVVANSVRGGVSVLLGTGTGTFGTQITYAAGIDPSPVTTADVNGDGRPDLVVANEFGPVSVLLNNSTPGASLDATSFVSAPGRDTGLAVDFTNGPAVAPTITGAVAGQTTVSEAPVTPFSHVTITDANNGGIDTDTLSIIFSGGGTLTDGAGFAGTSSLSGSNGSYTLTGTAAAITAELRLLSFTPVNGVPSTQVATTFTLSDTSTAGTTSASNSVTTVIDHDPPIVNSVTASTVGNISDLDAARVVTITVGFSGPVAVTGTPELQLNDSEVAAYTGGTGTSSLTFSYTVQPGDNIADLQVQGLLLNNGTIKDGVGSNALVANAVADLHLQIDTAAPSPPPTLALTHDTGVSSSDKITSDPSITYSTPAPGDTLRYKADSGSFSTVVPVFATDHTADGVHTVTVEEVDPAGNISTSSLTFTLDTTPPAPPTLALRHDNGVSNSDHITNDPTITYMLSVIGDTLLYRADGGGFSAVAPTFAIDHTADSPHTVSIEEIDAAGNISTATSLSFMLDTIVPAQTSVTAIADNGHTDVGIGHLVTITVDTGDAVTVTGTPTLTLSDGATARYAAGSGTTALTFDYTVAAGDLSADLHVTGYTGTIHDVAGNALAPVSGDLGLQIDGVAPTGVLSFVTDSGGTDLNHGHVVTFTLATSENVTVTGAPELQLSDGEFATYSSGASTATALAFSYTVAAGDNSADLHVAGTNPNGGLVLNGGTILDAVGNPLAGSVSTDTHLIIDTTAPLVSGITASPGSGGVFTGSTVELTLAINEAVTLTGTPSLTLNDGATATYDAAATTALHDATKFGFDYLVSASDQTTSLAVTGFAPHGATIHDLAGNAADLNNVTAAFAALSINENIAPAYTIGGLTRPALELDQTGHIVLDQVATNFEALYGTKALYMGLPASTPYPPVADPHDFHLV
jgi:hypothetical protein